MNIIPDLVMVAWQMAPFLVLMVGLQFLLFKPMLGYLEERTHATDGALREAADLTGRAETRLAEWEQAMAKAKAEITELRSARRAEANADYAGVLAEARKQADARIAEATAALRAEADQARTQLSGMARALATQAASQVLGRQVEA